MRPQTAVLSCAIGAFLIAAGFSLGRFVMMDPDVMTSFMLALVPLGAFLFLEGLFTLWRDARLRSLRRTQKP